MSNRKAFTVVELVVTLALSAIAVAMTVNTTTVFFQQLVTDIAADRTEKSANRFMIEFKSAMKGTLFYAIYPDRNTWETNPTGIANSGNFIIMTTYNGGTMAFELSNGNVHVINEPFGSNEILTCNTSATATGSGGKFVNLLNGVPTLAWSVATTAEVINFRVCAQPLREQ